MAVLLNTEIGTQFMFGRTAGPKKSSSIGVIAFEATGNHPNQSKRGKPRFHLY